MLQNRYDFLKNNCNGDEVTMVFELNDEEDKLRKYLTDVDF